VHGRLNSDHQHVALVPYHHKLYIFRGSERNEQNANQYLQQGQLDHYKKNHKKKTNQDQILEEKP
jgi:hypothetical protein